MVIFLFHDDKELLKNFLLSINKEQSVYVKRLFKEPHDKYERARMEKFTESLNKFLEVLLGFKYQFEHRSMVVKGVEKDLDSFLDFLNHQASPGERNLFYMCIFLASLVTHRATSTQSKYKERLTILLDEPELHLHQNNVTRFIKTIIDELISVSSNATLWVASHSVHLIPEFKFNEIVYIKDHDIQKRSGNFYSDIYESLVGTTQNLSQFLQDIAIWEMTHFFEQTLYQAPTAILTDDKDIQIKQIWLTISKQLEEGKHLHVLDYGAGKGRFGMIFDDLLRKKPSYKLSYSTYDLDDQEYNKYIKGKINCHSNQHYLPSSKLPLNHFDYILLVNVLHEISPKDWQKTFQSIHKMLKEDGQLIFCEALILSKGEYLGQEYGYLILEEQSIKHLFGNSIAVDHLPVDSEKIRAEQVVIDKAQLKKFNEETSKQYMVETLEILAKQSYKTYFKLLETSQVEKGEHVQFLNARKLAFYGVQYIML